MAEERSYAIEGVLIREGNEVVEKIEKARIEGDVDPGAILRRYETTARAILTERGFTEEEVAGARFRVREL